MLARAVKGFLEHSFDFKTREVMLGICTKYKDAYAYQWSPKTPKVMRISHLLSLLVDAPKQGILFNKQDWDTFRHENSLHRT